MLIRLMCLVCLINLILFIIPILQYLILFILPIESCLVHLTNIIHLTHIIHIIYLSYPVHPLSLHLVHSKVGLIDVFDICARSHVIYIRRTSSFATSAPASVMVKFEDFLSRISEDLTSLWPPYLVLKRTGKNILVFLWSQRIHQFGRITVT